MSDEDGFRKYELTLYCEDDDGNKKTMASGATTKKNYYNFKSKMTRSGDYYFRVKVIAKGSSYSDSSWSDYSDCQYIDKDSSPSSSSTSGGPGTTTATTAVVQAGWTLDNTGWRYRYANGLYPMNSWMQDTDGCWYYFNESGYMKTGWIEYNGNWYYCDANGSPFGVMVTGSKVIDGATYNFDASGAWIQ